MKNSIFSIILLKIIFSLLPATAGNGEITGIVMDTFLQQNIPLANVTVTVANNFGSYTFITNDAGIYYANNIPSGTYDVQAQVLAKFFKITGVKVETDKSTVIDIQANTLLDGVELEPVKAPPPLIVDRFDPKQDIILTEDLKNSKIKTIADAEVMIPGAIVDNNGEIHMSGARGGNTGVIIDGMHVIGSSNVPSGSISYFRSYSGGLPAKYGDVSGGLIVIETKSYFNQ